MGKKKNRKRLVWGIVNCALVAGLIPYRFRRDKETDDMEIRSLLWGVKKFTVDGKQHFAFAMPSSGLDNEEKIAEALKNR